MHKTAQKISRNMGLTSESLEQRKRTVCLTDADERLIQSFFGELEPHLAGLTDHFCQHLLRFYGGDELVDREGLAQFEAIQKTALQRMFSGQYDLEYALDRLATGLFYQEMGVEQEQIFGAFGSCPHYLDVILKQQLALIPQQRIDLLCAFNKLLFLDMALVLEAYKYNADRTPEQASEPAGNGNGVTVKTFAFYDGLSAFPNRHIISEHLEELLAVARHEQHRLALVYMDTVELQEVNDTLGHEVGDLLLHEVSRRLKKVVREMDLPPQPKSANAGALVRITGGEFGLAFFVADEEGVASLVARINHCIDKPFRIGDLTLSVRMRYGVVLASNDGSDHSTLMRRASLALTQAKERASMICFYDSSLGRRLKERTYMAHRLEIALKQENGLELRFQPQVDLASGVLHGVEVLLRWHDQELGWVSPDQFIPLAEQRGLIGLVTRWVLAMACRQCRIWRDKGGAEERREQREAGNQCFGAGSGRWRLCR